MLRHGPRFCAWTLRRSRQQALTTVAAAHRGNAAIAGFDDRGEGARHAFAVETTAAWFAAAAAAGCLLLSSPATRRPGTTECAGTQRVRLGAVEDFELGAMQEVPVGPDGGGASVLVHRHGAGFYATSSVCSHYGAPLKKGVSSAGRKGGAPTVSCPLHDATFDLRTGAVVRGPGLDGIAAYKVEVVNGTVFAEVPAELLSAGAKHKKVESKMCRRNTKDARTFVLIGAGPAALAAAETLRQEGFPGRIVMLSKEAHLPYDRVVLSKNLDKTAEQLMLRPPDFFAKTDIEVMQNATVTKVDTSGKKVHFTTAEGAATEIAYNKVLVATGGTPRKLFVPGASLPGIFTLRTPEDAAKITSYARKGQKIVVVGGSFIGMEIASSLRKKGCEVAVVAMETVPFERVLGKKVGASFARLLQKEGVEWFGTAQVRMFRGNDAVNGVELEDGEVLPADAVVVGAGVLPNTRFLDGVKLDKNGAIIVGPLLSSEADPDLFAAGDVCSYPALSTGTQVRIEHWDVATQQGRVAAKNMLGMYQPFTTTPFFWSGLFGKNLRFVGHAPDVLDRVIIEGDVSGFEFVSYYTEDNEIRAVATVNRDPVAVACAELMRRGQMPSVSELVLGVVNSDILLERLKNLSAAAA